jgi:hypothetical protein
MDVDARLRGTTRIARDARLRGDARSRDGGVRQEVAAGIGRVLINAQMSAWGVSGNVLLNQSITGHDPERS